MKDIKYKKDGKLSRTKERRILRLDMYGSSSEGISRITNLSEWFVLSVLFMNPDTGRVELSKVLKYLECGGRIKILQKEVSGMD